MIALSSSVHIYARPEAREKLLEFFTDMLGLPAVKSSDARGAPEDIYAFGFSNGAWLSVEFTEDALDDQHAQRGAWLELKVDEAEDLQRRLLAAGLQRVVHPYTPFFYIQAPGGQVFRIASR
jgi:catechol 2,3-dioxygenase-like lactoylglutathione lyase family enzyme